MTGPDIMLSDRAIAKAGRRLIPFLIICYFVAYLDRVNLGFAALTMNKEMGFGPIVFSLGAGIFFIGYFLFEIPSNVILERAGARLWIARIMISWGIVSGAMAFIQGETSFYVVRFLLGLAEAGFFPGIILYLTYWFPAEQRAKIVGTFMVAIPVSSVIGAPVSGWLLGFDGVLGLQGWQVMFLVEAVPAIVLGFFVLLYLTDRPEDARWLDDAERAALSARMAAERNVLKQRGGMTLAQALANPRVFALGIVYLGVVTGLYGINLWMPQIVKAFGLSNLQTGFVSAVPFLAGAVGMVFWSRSSDRHGERVMHVALPAFLGAVGLFLSTRTTDPTLSMAALSLGAVGIFAALPVFWSLPTALLTGTAAAGGIAFINSIGNLGGFGGPYVVGWLKELTGDTAAGMLVLAGGLVVAGMVVILVSRAPAGVEATDGRA
jgi:D-galactonate transporter